MVWSCLGLIPKWSLHAVCVFSVVSCIELIVFHPHQEVLGRGCTSSDDPSQKSNDLIGVLKLCKNMANFHCKSHMIIIFLIEKEYKCKLLYLLYLAMNFKNGWTWINLARWRWVNIHGHQAVAKLCRRPKAQWVSPASRRTSMWTWFWKNPIVYSRQLPCFHIMKK